VKNEIQKSSTVGHTGINALGESTSVFVGVIQQL